MTSHTQRWYLVPRDLPLAELQRLADLLGVSLEDLVALLRDCKLEYRLPRPGRAILRRSDRRGRLVEWPVLDEAVLTRLLRRVHVAARQAAHWAPSLDPEDDQAGDDLGPEL